MLPAIALSVVILLLERVTADIGNLEYDTVAWEDYLNREVKFQEYDTEQARTAPDDTEEVIKRMTEIYDVPKSWSNEFTSEAPFVALLYNTELVNRSNVNGTWKKSFTNNNICGGVVLTRNTVLTLCTCVVSLLVLNEFTRSQKTLTNVKTREDLGKDPYVIPFAERLYYQSEDRGYNPVPLKYKINRLGEEAGLDQYRNKLCLDAIESSSTADQKADSLQNSQAILEFSPSFDLHVPEWYVPWPPIVINYDDEIWAGKRRRQTVSIYSYGFLQFKNTSAYKVEGGELVDTQHSLMKFRINRCDITECKTKHTWKPDDFSSLGCFCDKPKQDTLCHGIVGSPAMYEGLLYGLLVLPMQCDSGLPRTIYIKGFTNKVARRFTNAIPELYYKKHGISEENAFLANSSSQVGEYTFFFPPRGVDQGIDSKLEIPEDELDEVSILDKFKENKDELHKIGFGSSPRCISTPSMFVAAIHISIPLLISQFDLYQ